MRAWVVAVVTIIGCAVPTPSAPTPAEPTGPLRADPSPAVPPSWSSRQARFAVPAALQQTGGTFTVLRLRQQVPLVGERVTVVPGTAFVELTLQPDEAVALASQSSSTTQPAGCTASPATSARVLRVPDAFLTIQAAIDAALPGDTVLVGPGRFTESVHLRSGVTLRGSGADLTTLDAQGEARTLVDFTDATDVTIADFTFTGVGLATTCGDDVFGCSGDWYRAAIFADGHSSSSSTGEVTAPCTGSSAFIVHNRFVGNAIAVLPYFHALAVVENNVFAGNRHDYVANHLQDVGAVLNNTFFQSAAHAVAIEAGYVDVVDNVVAGADVAFTQQYVQRGRVQCNLFFQNASVQLTLGQDGNLEGDPAFVASAAGDFHLGAGSAALDTGCSENGTLTDPDGSPTDVGAYGGAYGAW